MPEKTFVASPMPATLFKKRDSDTSISCKFCEMFKNTLFTEHLRVTASGFLLYDEVLSLILSAGCYHDIVFMVPVNAYLKSKLLVEEQFSLKSKIKFGYACLFLCLLSQFSTFINLQPTC